MGSLGPAALRTGSAGAVGTGFGQAGAGVAKSKPSPDGQHRPTTHKDTMPLVRIAPAPAPAAAAAPVAAEPPVAGPSGLHPAGLFPAYHPAQVAQALSLAGGGPDAAGVSAPAMTPAQQQAWWSWYMQNAAYYQQAMMQGTYGRQVQQMQAQFYAQQQQQAAAAAAARPAKKRKSDGFRASGKGKKAAGEAKVCCNCGTSSTPFWRKDKEAGQPLCNACGLYFAKNDAPRPAALWKAPKQDMQPAAATVVEDGKAAGEPAPAADEGGGVAGEPAPAADDAAYGSECVGKRLSILWDLDRTWYKGSVTGFDPATRKHAIRYDNGETEEVALARVEFVFEKEAEAYEGEEHDDDHVVTETRAKGGEPASDPSAADAAAYGSECVGERLSIFWDLDRAWYKGSVTGFDPATRKHAIQYDDGDTEEVELAHEVFAFEKEVEAEAAEALVILAPAEAPAAATETVVDGGEADQDSALLGHSVARKNHSHGGRRRGRTSAKF